MKKRDGRKNGKHDAAEVLSLPSLPMASAPVVLDKRGFAARWQFSPRTVDNFLRDGLPHCKVGTRRIRIIASEGDRWMLERFSTRRAG